MNAKRKSKQSDAPLSSLSDEDLALLKEQTFIRLNTLRDRYAEIYKEMEPIFQSHKDLEDEVDRRTIASFGDNPDWAYLLEETGSTSTARYKAANEAIDKLSSNLAFSGYTHKIQQRHVRVCLGENEDVSSCLKGLETLAPFLKYQADEDGEEEGSSIHRIGVTSNDLSASGVLYIILFKGEPRVELRKLVYGRTRLLEKFDNLESALKYITKEYYYG